MSVTRIICGGCGLVQMHCACPKTHVWAPRALLESILTVAEIAQQEELENGNAARSKTYKYMAAELRKCLENR